MARAKGRGKGGLGATQQPEGVAGSGAQLRWGRSSSKLLKQARPCPRGSGEWPCTVELFRNFVVPPRLAPHDFQACAREQPRIQNRTPG